MTCARTPCSPEAITSGQMSYDLRRLRMHGLIPRIPHTHRYQVTSTGLTQAMFLTRLHDRVLRAGLAQLTDPGPHSLLTNIETRKHPRAHKLV